jgi:hypothetical protein
VTSAQIVFIRNIRHSDLIRGFGEFGFRELAPHISANRRYNKLRMPDAKQTLEQYYFEMRWRALSLAADLDRVERGEGGKSLLDADPRIAKLRQAFSVLLSPAGANRAEQVQMIFSDKSGRE